MTVQVAGRLRALCAPGVEEPIAGATVSLWRAQQGAIATLAVHLGSGSEPSAAALASGHTGEDGSFRLEIAADPESVDGDAGALMLEVRLADPTPAGEPVRLRFGRVTPRWSGSGPDRFAHLDLLVTAEQWASVRDALDLWTVQGKVLLTTGAPAAGHIVFVHDCDALHDDFLGSAPVGADGSFRLDFRGSDFRPAPIGGFDPERGGPDLHFHVQSHDGTTVYEEPSSRGMMRDRANASNWFTVELRVEPRPAHAVPVPPPPRPRPRRR